MPSQLKENSSLPDQYEAVIRELTRGHALTKQLHAEATRTLQGHQGQAETAASILQEVSRTFTVCLSMLSSSAQRSAVIGGGRRAKDDNATRKRVVTSTPHHDGYQWRKYGQKKIQNTNFPRCYYRCSQRDLNCPATKQVQQQTSSNPPSYLVIYVHEHTCHTSTIDPEPTDSTKLLDFSGAPSTTAQQPHVDILDHGMKEEQELQAFVSSLASVLGSGCSTSEVRELPNGTSTASSNQASVPILDEGLDMDYTTDTPIFGSYDHTLW